jgi:hypothetical protein
MGMSFNFGGSKSRSNASNQGTDFSRQLALVEQRSLRTNNKQAEAIKNVQKDNRVMKRANLKVLAENKIIKDTNFRLQAQIDDLKTDKAEMLALHTANKKLQAQMDRINDLLTGVELVVAR